MQNVAVDLQYICIVEVTMPAINHKEMNPVYYSQYSAKVIYRHSFAPNVLAFSLHWHEQVELLRILEGSLSVTCANATYTLYPGDVGVFSPEILHSGTAGPEGAVYNVILFDLKLLINQTQASSEYIVPLCKGHSMFEPLSQSQQVRDAVDAIVQAHREETQLHPLQVMNKLYELVGLLYRYSGVRGLAAQPKQKQLLWVVDYINEHYDEQITLDFLSQQIGYSKAHFCRKFKQETGMTVNHYIERLRMDKAKNLLAETDMPIKDISLACGYSDLAYFTNRCKKMFHQPPAQLRRESRKHRRFFRGNSPDVQ